MSVNNDLNLEVARSDENRVMEKMMTGQRMQEVQAMAVMAKRFPRDTFEALARIKEACQRRELAEQAFYLYERGGEKVTGPSIRLAEVVMQSWGNVKAGVIELEQELGESRALAYAWDIQSNTYDEKVFTVPHIRESKKLGRVKIESPRDIYEMVANMGARRKRACIQAVIPSFVWVEAEAEIRKTLKAAGATTPFADRLRKLLELFKTRYGVSKEMMERFVGKPIDSFVEDDGVTLQALFTSLKEGAAKKEDFFDFTIPGSGEDTLSAELKSEVK